MLDLYDELTNIVDALETASIEYAICGGIAVAIWAFPRATVDIDLLVQESSLDAIFAQRSMPKAAMSFRLICCW